MRMVRIVKMSVAGYQDKDKNKALGFKARPVAQ
jgi:hypothetical protein